MGRLAKYVDGFLCVHQIFFSEILVMLAEVNFRGVPVYVRQSIAHWARTWFSTLIAEEGFHTLRYAERFNPSKNSGRFEKHYQLQQSKLLSEHGRTAPTVGAHAKTVAPPKPPQHVFTGSAGEFSRGKDLLDRIVSDPNYMSRGPTNLYLQANMLTCFMQCRADPSLMFECVQSKL